MNKWMFATLFVILSSTLTYANCDLKSFRWECDLPVNVRAQAQASSLVYCDNINVYVTRAEYDQIARYQRNMVDMNLVINGEFFGGPCIPVRR